MNQLYNKQKIDIVSPWLQKTAIPIHREIFVEILDTLLWECDFLVRLREYHAKGWAWNSCNQPKQKSKDFKIRIILSIYCTVLGNWHMIFSAADMTLDTPKISCQIPLYSKLFFDECDWSDPCWFRQKKVMSLGGDCNKTRRRLEVSASSRPHHRRFGNSLLKQARLHKQLAALKSQPFQGLEGQNHSISTLTANTLDDALSVLRSMGGGSTRITWGLIYLAPTLSVFEPDCLPRVFPNQNVNMSKSPAIQHRSRRMALRRLGSNLEYIYQRYPLHLKHLKEQSAGRVCAFRWFEI